MRFLERILSSALARFLAGVLFALFAALWTNYSNAGVLQSMGTYDTQAHAIAACQAHHPSGPFQSGTNAGNTCTNNPHSTIKAQFGTGPIYACKRVVDPLVWVTCSSATYPGGWDYYQWSFGACPEDYEPNSVTGLCEYVEPDPPYDCGIGFINEDGGSTVESCVPIPPVDGCENPLGYIDGETICGDDALDCAASGGSFGQINGVNVCIPDGDDIPRCEPGTFVFVPEGGSTFACVTPNPTPPPGTGDVPEGQDYGDPEEPGEGGTDPDQTGAGPTQTGPCDPTDRDYSTCIGELETISETTDDNIRNQAGAAAGTASQKYLDKLADEVGDGVTDVASGEADGLADDVADLVDLPSCSDLTVTVAGKTGTLSCVKFAPLRNMLGYFLSILTAFSVFGIILQRGPN